jgi:hypothetical protein
MRRRRHPDRFDSRAAALSGMMHVMILVLAWLSTFYAPEPIQFLTYEIELVSPPPAVEAEEPRDAAEELVVERPDPEPTPPEPEVEEIVPIEEPAPEPEPEPEPPREEPTPDEEPEVAEEEVEAAVVDLPEEVEEPDETGEGLEVRIEGLRRDYPEYYNNIIRQILRCFRWQDGGRWETEVFFYIIRDGTAEGIEFVSRSGNTAFDFEAMGAVDCAGNGRFGPLPDDLPYDRFPIKFSFRPQGTPMMELPNPGRPTKVTSER